MTLPASAVNQRYIDNMSLWEISAESPCVGFCTTLPDEDVCRSYLRTFDEITRWVEMSEVERRALNLRIVTLRTTGFRPAPE